MSSTRLTLYGILIAAAALFGIGWLSGSEFMANLLSETLGILATVFVVDKLLALETKKARHPASLAAFREALDLLAYVDEFTWAAMVSSLPNTDVSKAESEASKTTQPWMVDYLAALNPSQDSNRASLVDGSRFVAIPWETMLYEHRKAAGEKISRYLERHAVNADPEITAAVYGLEKNGLFTGMDNGPALFWNRLSGQIGWGDFLPKIEDLRESLRKHAAQYPEATDDVPAFGWKRMVEEIKARKADITPNPRTGLF